MQTSVVIHLYSFRVTARVLSFTFANPQLKGSNCLDVQLQFIFSLQAQDNPDFNKKKCFSCSIVQILYIL